MTPREIKAAYDREYRAKSKARVAANKKAWADANPDKTAATARAWAEANPEKAAAAKKAWKVRNPDADKEYRAANYESVKGKQSAYRAAHKAEIAAQNKAYRDAFPELARARSEAYRAQHRPEAVERTAEWRAANPEKYAAQLAKAALQPSKPRTPEQKAHHAAHQSIRCRRLVCAQPPWADRKAIDAIYLKAQQSGMHVDHIIPLKGKTVSGLHVESNLQLLTPRENHRKHNKFSPEAHHAC